MTRRIAIIQGHPDPAGHHLLHAMADAYAEGATSAGHEVRRIEVAKLEFPLLRTQVDFETGALPPALVATSGRHALGGALGFSISALARNHAGAVQGLSRAHFPTWLCHGIQEGPFPETDCSPGARPASS